MAIKSLTLGLAVVVGIGAVLLSTEAGAVPVTNPSFETVQIGSPFTSTNVANVPGWTRSGAAGDAAVWHVGYVDGGGSITVAGEGLQFTTLGGGATGVVDETHWSQTIGGFVPGQDYVLRFMMATEHGTVIPQFAISQTITVSLLSGSDTAPQSFTEDAPDGANYWRVWVEKLMAFHATGSTVTLDFGSITAFDVGLDNVRIDAAGVPEPGSLLLLGIGLAVLAPIRRARAARRTARSA